ncbi:hypothetical protein BD410DRAFT_379410 [Rickenella mellea]|uniref:Uncharacterized protein n=1 Tax=Rickenella mellea TaxID=50990 RepID=A0A4Y7PY67_9AGAM|nr:hypothetical protein BD410DRAFT_379410 [Rickenella mellea]
MASTQHLHFDNTLGVLLIGTIMSSMLYGITNVQTFIYFQRFPKDSNYLRVLVAFLWVLDGLHMSLGTYSVYFHMVDNFLNPFALLIPTWFGADSGFVLEISYLVSVQLAIIITHISDFIVRSFFIRRVWIRKKLYVGWKSEVTLAMMDRVGGLGFGIKMLTSSLYRY